MAFLYLIGAFFCFFMAFGVSWAQDSSMSNGDEWWHYWNPDPEGPIGSFIITVKTILFFGGGLYCAFMVMKLLFT